ncbi:MAG: protein kinase [Sandaracinaceae bacterium]
MTDTSDATMTVTVGSTSPGVRPEESAKPLAPRLWLGEKIAEGGMGIVWRGHQRHLGREVAVKTLRPERTGAGEVAQLLQEAWITGQLEHPNIVPIHDIVLDEDERPQVVLKRVEGKSWRDLLREPEEVRTGFQTEDPLEWHVRIVISVCNALELAHSRGVVHRDVKPSNVMVGKFGEVYVLDWGLAVGLKEDPSGRLPALNEGNALAGSSAYMAPEQLSGVPRSVGFGTDVYLVGACLYEVLAGTPPFAERKLEEAAFTAASPAPELPPEVPEELAALVRSAMAPDPKERPRSIRALRLRLEAFLKHRGSRSLAADARTAAEAMRRHTANGDDREAESAFAQASFAYRAAIQAWPGNEAAHQALTELTLERARAALSSARPEVAAQLVSTLDHTPADFRAEIAAAQAMEEKKRAKAAALSREHDRSVGQRARQRVVALSGSAWVVTWSVLAWVRASATTLAVCTAGFLALALVSAAMARRDLAASKPNQGIFWTVMCMIVAQLCLYLVGPGMGLSDASLMTLTLLLWALPCAIGAATIDSRFAPVPAGFFLAFVVAAWVPSTLPWIVGTANVLFIVTSLLVNYRVGRESDVAEVGDRT